MTARRSLSARERLRLFALHGGVCHLCGGKIDATREGWDVSHVIPLAIGGAEGLAARPVVEAQERGAENMSETMEGPPWPVFPDALAGLRIARRAGAEFGEVFVGCVAFVRDENHRVYVPGKSGPVERHHYVARKIVGETRVSWIDSRGTKHRKVPAGRPTLYGSLDVDDALWARKNRHRVVRLVEIASPLVLRQIATLLEYEEPTS